MTQETVAEMLKTIESSGSGLSQWELDFIESVTGQFEQTGSLSPRQIDIVQRIYNEKT